MRPIIGVTSGRRMVTSTKGETRATVLYTTYTNMVRHAGGMPVVLTPGPAEEASSIIDGLDGLVLSGGGDVAPSIYGGVAHEAIYEVDPLRDEYELALARAAHDRRLPTLAICRGMQVANVAFGGTLIEDIASERPDASDHQIGGPGTVTPHHVVKVESGSAIATAVGTDTPNVNTIHHQALRDVADMFQTTGHSPDGIIEAIEAADEQWPMWGVQWHPEYLGQHDGPSLHLFETLVAEAKDAMKS